jgi:hypothetical protein
VSFSSAETGQRTRQQISQEAARLMADEGVLDHQTAKTKAIERLGLPANAPKPDNREIEGALIDHLRLFDQEALIRRQRQWRQIALDAMRLLDAFRPKLIGPVLSGTITRFSKAHLLVIASPETISIFLDEREIPYDQNQKRMRQSTSGYRFLPTFQFVVDEVRVELICLESEAIGRTLLCPVTGKPVRRAGADELERLLTSV